jgi:hypothetical protein
VRQTNPGRQRFLGLCMCLLSAALFLLAVAFKQPAAAVAGEPPVPQPAGILDVIG